MDSIQSIKSRLETAKNIGQITKAMEVVSATKMRRAQELALSSRPYARAALEILARLDSARQARVGSQSLKSELTQARPVKTTLLAVISSDRGLAGSFNTQVFRAADNFLASRRGSRVSIVAIGKKAARWAEKKMEHQARSARHSLLQGSSHARPVQQQVVYGASAWGETPHRGPSTHKDSPWPSGAGEGAKIEGQFSGWGNYGSPEEIEPLLRLLIDGFAAGRWDEVITISTHFRTTLKQEVLQRQILPVDTQKIAETVNKIIPERGRYAQTAVSTESAMSGAREIDYILEPTPQKLIDFLIPHLVKMQIYHLVLEANASEHSARMVAMKSASDNAQELLGELRLEYNKARQAGITRELTEITAGKEALTQ